MAKKSHGVFKLTGEHAGKTMVINDKYSFVKGEMPASVSDAALIEPILCQYYGCELSYVDAPEDEVSDETSLNVANTKGNDSLQADVTKPAAETGKTK